MYSTDTFEIPLVVHIMHQGESIEINVHSINISIEEHTGEFIPWEEPKWRRFCKAHNFNRIKDYGGKIYRLYLELCAEGMV